MAVLLLFLFRYIKADPALADSRRLFGAALPGEEGSGLLTDDAQRRLIDKRRVLNGIQDYYNRKGLYSDKGEKKKAFYVLKEWYSKK